MNEGPSFRPHRLLFNASVQVVRFLGSIYSHIHVDGQAFIPRGAFIAVFNHSSTLDVAAMAHVVPGPVCFWAKAELAGVPLIGAWLKRCGAVFIKRGQRDEAAFAEALRRLGAGLPFFLAPEGTRRHEKGAARTHTGFVRLAQLARVPILPCAISGASQSLPPGSLWPRGGRVGVRIGAPLILDFTQVDEAHRAQLLTQAGEVMAEVYRMKAELDRDRDSGEAA